VRQRSPIENRVDLAGSVGLGISTTIDQLYTDQGPIAGSEQCTLTAES